MFKFVYGMLPPLSKQKMFDNALFGIRKQNYKCTLCQYKDTAGNKCHIGHSIPAPLYSKYLEGTQIMSPSIEFMFPELYKYLGLKDKDYIFLDELQSIHDKKLPHMLAHEYEAIMLRFAVKHNLKYTPPK